MQVLLQFDRLYDLLEGVQLSAQPDTSAWRFTADQCYSASTRPPGRSSGSAISATSRRYPSCALAICIVGNLLVNHCNISLQLQLLGCLSGVEMVLKDVGYPVKLGSGVAAAAAYLSNYTPLIPSRI